MEAYAGGAGSRNAAAEKERSYTGAGSTKAETERARLMLKNLELDEENKAHAGSKTENDNKLPQNPVPDEFPFSFVSWPRQECGKSAGHSMAWSGRRKSRRKKTYRLGMEYVDYVAKNPLPPLYLPDPRFSHLFTTELEERFVARQMAEREERENIIKQIKEFGHADVEVEVPDEDDIRIIRRYQEWASQN